MLKLLSNQTMKNQMNSEETRAADAFAFFMNAQHRIAANPEREQECEKID